jgi:hypothetical protein
MILSFMHFSVVVSRKLQPAPLNTTLILNELMLISPVLVVIAELFEIAATLCAESSI